MQDRSSAPVSRTYSLIFAVKCDAVMYYERTSHKPMLIHHSAYDSLKHWKVNKGSRVGVAGLGGVGTMSAKLAKALGATVTVLSHSEAKKEYAKAIGADNFVSMKDSDAVKGAAKTLDLILDTVSVNHEVMHYNGMLDTNGTHIILGLTADMGKMVALPMVFNRTGIHGSCIGGIQNTQEVIDLCAKHDIKPEIHVIDPQEITDAYNSLLAGNDGGFRYVIDVGRLKHAVNALTFEPVKSKKPKAINF